MNPRAVDAGNGWQWIVDGFHIFRKGAVMWIVLTLVLAILWLLSLMIPLLGPLLFNLFSPVFFAGILIGCRAIEQNEALELPHLFAGFKSNVSALVSVGGVYLAGTIIIIGIVLATVGASAFTMTKPGKAIDAEAAMALMSTMGVALTIALALYMPLMMAIWFAPALIVFENLGAMVAMKQSFAACLMNMMPFLVYGAVVMVLWIIASIPLLLGLLVLLPVAFCSVYTSYMDIFAASAQPPQRRDNPLLK